MKPRLLVFFSLSFFLSVLVNAAQFGPSTAQAADALPTWKATGFTLPNSTDQTCLDVNLPGVLVYEIDPNSVSSDKGWHTYNWLTGQQQKIDDHALYRCQLSGVSYETDYTGTVRRYTVTTTQGQVVDHAPTVDTHDPAYFYSLDSVQKKLWFSSDGGLTWQARGQQFNGQQSTLAVAPQDPRVIYLVTIASHTDTNANIELYVSKDAGVNWSLRSKWSSKYYQGFFMGLQVSPFSTSDVSYADNSASLWTNPVRLFQSKGDSTLASDSVNINEGFFENADFHTVAVNSSCGHCSGPDVFQLANAPRNYFKLQFGDSGEGTPTPTRFFYSTDAYQTQRQIGEGFSLVFVSPYAPTTLVGIDSKGAVFTLNLPEADATQTPGVIDNHVVGGEYFAATQHNLSPLFKTYWEQHGGLAQFGYPKTEAFREVNPADGKIYVVQYFERNRFEYHPEFKGTSYEVELGLLGNQLTTTRRANNEAPFKPVGNPNSADILFFPQTNHTLRLSFRQYWEQHGGLALYGYPISEEFQEVNPDDGKTYTVQYFERNRFEYHPDNKGTQYEVELGLLGNTLLQQKGWVVK